jgi:TatD DNase family protein
MLIDTHAHVNFNAYKNDADEVIRRSLENDIWTINVGTKYETSKKAVELAQKYEKGVYATVGLHPIHLETGLVKIKNDNEEIEVNTKEEDFDCGKYKELAKLESRLVGDLSKRRVVAIGEVGLDYYWRPKTTKKKEIFKQKQKYLLLKQLELAKELNLPVIFHCRMAHQDLIQFLKENRKIRPKSAVAHGFVGNLEKLKEYLNFGYYIGFNGIIFKNIEGIDFKENIKNTPLDKVLIETDCPYLTPLPAEALAKTGPLPGRNEPLYVKYVAEEIAKIKNLSYEEISRVTTQNAQKLFEIH